MASVLVIQFIVWHHVKSMFVHVVGFFFLAKTSVRRSTKRSGEYRERKHRNRSTYMYDSWWPPDKTEFNLRHVPIIIFRRQIVSNRETRRMTTSVCVCARVRTQQRLHVFALITRIDVISLSVSDMRAKRAKWQWKTKIFHSFYQIYDLLASSFDRIHRRIRFISMEYISFSFISIPMGWMRMQNNLKLATQFDWKQIFRAEGFIFIFKWFA